MVIDPWALLEEIETLRAAASRSGRTICASPRPRRSSCRCTASSTGRERARAASSTGTGAIGATGAASAAYEDKIARRAVRVCDLAAPDLLARRVDELLLHHNALRRASATSRSSGGPARPAERAGAEAAAAPSRCGSAWPCAGAAPASCSRGQGAMLDVDHGTYPFVTSSNTLAAAAARRRHRPDAVATCSASPRRTPPGSARDRSRPSCTTTSAGLASAAASSAR